MSGSTQVATSRRSPNSGSGGVVAPGAANAASSIGASAIAAQGRRAKTPLRLEARMARVPDSSLEYLWRLRTGEAIRAIGRDSMSNRSMLRAMPTTRAGSAFPTMIPSGPRSAANGLSCPAI